MDAISGLPFFPLEITKEGRVFSPAQVAAIKEAVRESGAVRLTDVFVVSHGWNNDMADARQLYDKLFANVVGLAARHSAAENRKFAILGIFWPSKKFTDEELIPAGGAASIEEEGPSPTSAAIKKKLESLKGTFDVPDDAPLEQAKSLVDLLENSPAVQQKFVDHIRSLLPQRPTATIEDASDVFMSRPGDEILQALAPPSTFPVSVPSGRSDGGSLDLDDQTGAATDLRDLFSGMKAAAWRLLNFATYYQMKERAGVVGAGVNTMLAEMRQLRSDLRLHFIGHSFGARVVTAAVDGLAVLRPSSLTLLQGAFSHNGFTQKFDNANDGFFRKVIAQSKVNGPIVATHTVNDLAVGIAYPIASRLSADNASALGDENDVFGGLGRNGAVKMQPDEFIKGRLLPDASTYQLVHGKVHNLQADQFIAGHSDVAGPQVANAIIHTVLN